MQPQNPFIGLTLSQARRKLAGSLAKAGREPAAADARRLLEAATGLDHASLLRDDARLLTDAEAGRLGQGATRRLQGEPLSRILGVRQFHGLSLGVSPDVLDPREDTETVVRLAARLRPDRATVRGILDLGTGSGALLCALLGRYPAAVGVGVDLSPAACAAAQANLRACGFADRALVAHGRWADALAGPFDLIVSNPPYIASGDLAGLPDEVRLYDPPLALDGGQDGVDAYRTIFAGLRRIAAPGALTVVELGAGSRAAVEALLGPAGLAVAGVLEDTGGHERALAVEIV